MDLNKQEVFARIKQEIQSAALSRQDNGSIYIFMKENKGAGDKFNLLIFDDGNPVRKSRYSFLEKNGRFFIRIDGTDYEMLLPQEVSDEESFNFSMKAPDGDLIHFENYI